MKRFPDWRRYVETVIAFALIAIAALAYGALLAVCLGRGCVSQ